MGLAAYGSPLVSRSSRPAVVSITERSAIASQTVALSSTPTPTFSATGSMTIPRKGATA
jgi:hypothetical protein